MRNQQLPGLFQRGERLLARDGGEVVEEAGWRVGALEVVNECLQRHARSDKHRRSTQSLGVAVNGGAICRHGVMIAPSTRTRTGQAPDAMTQWGSFR